MAHPIDAVVVETVAGDARISKTKLHDHLTAVSDSLLADCADIIDWNTGEDADPEVDDPIIAEYPDRLTLHAQRGNLTETLDMVDIDRQGARDAIIEAFKQHAAHEGADYDDLTFNFALTLWKPAVRDYVCGGLTVQEARAQLLREAGYSQAAIQAELDLDTKSAAKNTLYRGDRKIKEAKRLVAVTDK